MFAIMVQIRRVYILILDDKIIDVWTNLKKLCADMREDDGVFPSYWTLARLSKEAKELGLLKVEAKDGKVYTIEIRFVR